MNINDELLTRSLAALAEDTTDDAAVEQHLEEFQAAYAKLDTDPVTVAQLDAAIAEVDGNREIVHREMLFELQQTELLTLRARLTTLQEESQHRRTGWVNRAQSHMFSLTGITSLLMIVATVLLGIFGTLSQLTVILPIFAAAVSVATLIRSYTQFYLVRQATHGSAAAERMLRLVHGGLSVELRDIEARERVAMSVINTSSSAQTVTIDLREQRLEVTQAPR